MKKRQRRKAANVVLHILNKCIGDPTFDDDKLKAILFECDLRSFIKTGKTITGLTYVKE